MPRKCSMLRLFEKRFFKKYVWHGCTCSIWKIPGARVQIGTTAAGLHHSHSNARSKPPLRFTLQPRGKAGSLIHWVRPGIKPASSWILCWALNPLSHNGKSWNNFLFCFVFIGLHSRHMEVHRLEIHSELQPLACVTATATQDPRSGWKRQRHTHTDTYKKTNVASISRFIPAFLIASIYRVYTIYYIYIVYILCTHTYAYYYI